MSASGEVSVHGSMRLDRNFYISEREVLALKHVIRDQGRLPLGLTPIMHG